jgi:hypothetical protein
METAMPVVEIQTLFGFGELSKRWTVSYDTLLRKAETGELKTIYVAGRRLVPLGEVQRVETQGLGGGRKRRAAEAR